MKEKIINKINFFRHSLKARVAEPRVKKVLILYVALPLILNFILEICEHRSLLGGFTALFFHTYGYLVCSLIIALTLSISLLSKRRYFWIALISVIWIIFGIANFVLLSNRVTPFCASDLYLINAAFSVMQKYLSDAMIVVVTILLVLVAIALAIGFFKGPKIEGKVNYVKSLITILLLGLFTFGTIEVGVNRDYIEGQFHELSQSYLKNGFVYCFSTSILDTGVSKPSNYSLETLESYISGDYGYEEASAAETEETTESDTTTEKDEEVTTPEETTSTDVKTPNIIYVQLESFFDVNNVDGLVLSENPIPNFTNLMENYASGFIGVPVVGAGTVNTEFEILTGMNIDDFGAGEYPYKTILKKTTAESMAYILKNHGYTTHGVHNNTGAFYSRNSVYANLGFDTFTSVEYMQIEDYTPTGWAKDSCLTDEIMDNLTSTEEQDLVFTVSVQGHGGYDVASDAYEHKITVDSIADESQKDLMEYYVNEIHEMDEFIGNLISTLENYDEDTIVVMYGDHLPSSGLTFSDETLNNQSIYQTNYFIWNNFDLDIQDEDIEAYQLSSKVFSSLGITDGVINSYHQNNKNSAYYLNGLSALEYDMLYGNQLLYDGSSPYVASDLQMGIEPITITDTYVDPYNSDYIIVKGKNFTKYSHIYVNGTKYSTSFIDSTTLRTKCDNLTAGDSITVWQSKLSETEAYIYNITDLQFNESTLPEQDVTTPIETDENTQNPESENQDSSDEEEPQDETPAQTE